MDCKCLPDSWICEPTPICDRYEPTADHYCVSCHHDALCHLHLKNKQEEKTMESKAWMIWDCKTGSVDGYYFNKAVAVSVLESFKNSGCSSIMLCEVEKQDASHGIPDHLFHASNKVGFFGRANAPYEVKNEPSDRAD
jgi:hypothetical protein